MRLIYDVYHPGERAAGIRNFWDIITIEVESGDPGGDEGEFVEFMRESLAEWFDGAGVTLIEKGEKKCLMISIQPLI